MPGILNVPELVGINDFIPPVTSSDEKRWDDNQKKNREKDSGAKGEANTAESAVETDVQSTVSTIEPDSPTEVTDNSDIQETVEGSVTEVTSMISKTNSTEGPETNPFQTAASSTPIRPTITRLRFWITTALEQSQRFITWAKPIRAVWVKRPKCPYTLYIVIMALMTAAATIFIQWGMYTEPTYDDANAVDATTKILNSVNGQLTKFVSQMWLEGKLNWLLNFCALGMIYLVLVFILNRFWVATAVFAIVMSSFAVANSIKVQLRNEPVIPSDLSFLSSGNGGEITSFVPKGSQTLVDSTITMLIWLTAICLIIQFVDGRRCVIPFHWWHPFRNVKTIIGNLTRFVAVTTSVALLWSFTWNLGANGSWSYNWAKNLGDDPILWSTITDATYNGAPISFLRLAHAKTMEKPEDYNKENMSELAERYSKKAEKTNQTRTSNLTDNTVIMVLSESFSDPTRVPGIILTEDPMPNIRSIKDSTTSGLMLSPSIGGGTANIEYQALTGLSLALFDDSMQSPYQELVPHQKAPYTFNQMWNTRYGQSGSVAFHPFSKNMYLRDANYKKFGFNHFYTEDSKPPIIYQDRIDSSPYVSDAASYQNVIYAIRTSNHSQFIQLTTMQNHAPYNDYYTNNQFKEADISTLPDDEKYNIDNYTKGINLTDQATANFLGQLNTINKPITVIFYGDHLPGVYSTAMGDKNNTLPLHETDYFIWSNQASASTTTKLDSSSTGFVSSNYFAALAATHMNAKVSPYLEMLTEMHAAIPALSRLNSPNTLWNDGSGTAYLDTSGNRINYKTLSEKTRALLRDYRLVQYDMTKGKRYLRNNFFAIK